MSTDQWVCVAELDEFGSVVSGKLSGLAAAVKRAADIRCYTTFDYAEHIGVPGSDVGLVEEMMDFGVSYWLEGGHSAAIQTLRYPANCSLGFMDAPSLSFFLYNDGGQSGIARPFLDGRKGDSAPILGRTGKYNMLDDYDAGTQSPSHNYTYQFGTWTWWVRYCWEEVLAHDERGNIICGSLEALRDAFHQGRSVKVGVVDLCADLAAEGGPAISHEVFVEMGPIYNHQGQGFLGGESHPLVRVAPGVPLMYRSGNWNFGWILPRTDGVVHQLVIDPYTREFIRRECRRTVRWFAC